MIIKNFDQPYQEFVLGITCFKCNQEEIINQLLSLITKTNGFDNNLIIQLFDANKIATWKHIFFATFFTLQSYFQKLLSSNIIELELLKWISGRKDILKAINYFGIQNKIENIAVVVIGKNKLKISNKISEILKKYNFEETIQLLEIDEKKKIFLKNFFKISDLEYRLLQNAKNEDNDEDLIVKLVINRISAKIIKK